MTTEPQKQEWPRVAVVGAGAVGGFFGGMLARAGASVILIGRQPLVDAVASRGLYLDSLNFQQFVPVTATTDLGAMRDASLVLFAVKTRDTRAAARAMAPHLAPGATVLSLQNGVDNVEQIRDAAGISAWPAVVYVAASVPEPGRIKHGGRGDLVIGDSGPDAPRQGELSRVAEAFARAGVPCRVSDNIVGDLWVKMVMNCAWNAVSALGRISYGRAAQYAETRDLVCRAAQEAEAVARASGVIFPAIDLCAAALKLAENFGEVFSSTAQDIAHGRRTEIDSLNGHVVRLGREFGIPTPANLTLYALVKMLEESALPPAGHQ